MKLKNVLLSLSLASVCLSQAYAQAQSPSARHIGDGVKSIGDTNRQVVGSPDERPDVFKPKGANAKPVSYLTTSDRQLLAPTICDTGCANACSSLGSCGAGASKVWFGVESLLWFSQRQQMPPLVTTSALGVLPVAGAPGVTTQYGGPDGQDFGLLPGLRLSGGMYLGDCQKMAIGGRTYGIFSHADQYNATSNGSTSLGLPFFNAFSGDEDAYLVGFTLGNLDPVSSGNVAVRSDLDMFGSDGSLYFLLGRSNNHRMDMIAGYTYNNLKSSVTVVSQSTNLFTGDLIPDGTVFTTNDLFETKNVFNGGHLGIVSSVVRNRVSLSTLSKISFGNMRQTGAIRGFTNTDSGAGITTTAGGIYTQPSNIGTFSQDSFAFIPELGLKLGLGVNEHVQLTLGYTFMFWSSVGLAGQQMDHTVDLTQTALRPAPGFVESSFWMQGIDLGLNFTY